MMRNIIIRNNKAGEVMLTVCFAHEDEAVKPLLDAVSEAFPEIVSLYYVINTKLNDSIADQECILYKGADAIWETMGRLKFKSDRSLSTRPIASRPRDFILLRRILRD